MFEIKEKFYLDGRPFQIISGSIHYFRTVREYWRDRLEKLKNMGCNTVETYIPWNFHEPERGKFLWDGMHDVVEFIRIAAELGLYIIIRPSPYICAEWEFGGLPAWLLKDKNMRLRCSYPPYLEAVKEYYSVLIPKLVPYQITCGGKIILIQIENEYGYYGNDTAYLEFLRDAMREFGITVPFVTSDGPWNENIFRSGMVNGALPTGNFGSGVEWQFGQMQKYIGCGKPLMCMEFWDGWFDAWGEEHHKADAEKAAKELDDLLRLGNLNFYMFEGGTNFGFMSGRNGGSRTGDVTSYDYDSPLTEDGNITEKYLAFKKIISRYRTIDEISLSTRITRMNYGKIKCSGRVSLFGIIEKISAPINSLYPLTMEDIGQNYGYILYRVELKENEYAADIRLENASDRILGYMNGRYIFTAFAENIGDKFDIEDHENGAVIDLLCENMGRENFGTGLEDQRKGISGGIKINDHRHFGTDIFPLPLDEKQLKKISGCDFSEEIAERSPVFHKFIFSTDTPGDTFIDPAGFGKGCIFINGFNLGRFWEIGPQKRSYIPAPLIRKGENEIIIFETEGKFSDEILLSDEPNLG